MGSLLSSVWRAVRKDIGGGQHRAGILSPCRGIAGVDGCGLYRVFLVQQAAQQHACLSQCDGVLAADFTCAGRGLIAAYKAACGSGADIGLDPFGEAAVIGKVGLCGLHDRQVCRAETIAMNSPRVTVSLGWKK